MNINQLNHYEKEELLNALNNYTCTLNYEQQSMDYKKTIGILIAKLDDNASYQSR